MKIAVVFFGFALALTGLWQFLQLLMIKNEYGQYPIEEYYFGGGLILFALFVIIGTMLYGAVEEKIKKKKRDQSDQSP